MMDRTFWNNWLVLVHVTTTLTSTIECLMEKRKVIKSYGLKKGELLLSVSPSLVRYRQNLLLVLTIGLNPDSLFSISTDLVAWLKAISFFAPCVGILRVREWQNDPHIDNCLFSNSVFSKTTRICYINKAAIVAMSLIDDYRVLATTFLVPPLEWL